MGIIVSLGAGVAGGLWIWGALSGRLASMIAAFIQPKWVGASSGSSSSPSTGGSGTSSGGSIVKAILAPGSSFGL